jgi:4-hydroxy-4-methyl-2-oxoglutarate aldolase
MTAVRYEPLPTGCVSDAMEELEMPRGVLVGFQLVGDPDTVICGPAFTVKQGRKPAGTDRHEQLMRHGEVSRSLAPKGSVVVVDVEGIRDVAAWGEAHSYRCLKRGVAGLIMNGAIRDARSIEKSGFPAFCKGYSPVKSQWDLATESIGEPLTIDGVGIRTGDIVVADINGVIIVPSGQADSVFKRAQEIHGREIARDAALRDPGPNANS